MDIATLIERQRANIAVRHALMTERKVAAPTASRSGFAEDRWSNISLLVRDTAFKSRPSRSLTLNGNDYEATIYTDGGKVVERFDLRADDAQSRLDRYAF